MKAEQVLETYDEGYARQYDSVFNLSPWAGESVKFQLGVLEKYLKKSGSWLDVACGTGFFLGHFPDIKKKAGMDLSPSMLGIAKERNQDADFVEGNFLDDYPEWQGKWDLVSCMGCAYSLVESLHDIKRLIMNLALFCSDKGVCILPIANIRKFDSENILIPFLDEKVNGRMMITGITYTWVDEQGKRHDDAFFPQVEFFVENFEKYFHSVEVLEGPLDKIGEGWRMHDILIAKGKISEIDQLPRKRRFLGLFR